MDRDKNRSELIRLRKLARLTQGEMAKAMLVNNFSGSTTRPKLWRHFENFVSEIPEGCVSSISIDGSYATCKINPEDIDIIIYARADATGDHLATLNRLMKGSKPHLHPFLVSELLKGLHNIEEAFHKDLLGRYKGMVSVDVQ